MFSTELIQALEGNKIVSAELVSSKELFKYSLEKFKDDVTWTKYMEEQLSGEHLKLILSNGFEIHLPYRLAQMRWADAPAHD